MNSWHVWMRAFDEPWSAFEIYDDEIDPQNHSENNNFGGLLKKHKDN